MEKKENIYLTTQRAAGLIDFHKTCKLMLFSNKRGVLSCAKMWILKKEWLYSITMITIMY